MVYLSKIYTKSGDNGSTGLCNGDRVAKTDPYVSALGAVDELNAWIGMIRTLHCNEEMFQVISNTLFDLGADLGMPLKEERAIPRITPRHVEQLETWIDAFNKDLSPLTSFVLPGGSQASAYCHVARTVCRRAEREAFSLAEKTELNHHICVYLNRLSDFLFICARKYNDNGQNDILWFPGGN